MKTIKFTADNSSFEKIAYWTLMSAIFLIYWLFSHQYTGPAYLTDEIGYLTKAAAFAGYPVDLANHWNGGYSLIISPIFMIFSDPLIIWQLLMIFNAAIWVLSFMLLFRLLNIFFPNREFWSIFSAVAISAIYPAWISMSGYAFSTTLFVFIFLLSIYAMLKISLDSILSVIPHTLLVGFLYWIHPAGMIIAGASLLVLAAYSWRYSQYRILLFYFFSIVLLIAVYKFGIHYWLDQTMTAKNYTSLSKYKSISSVIMSAFNLKFWVAWAIMGWGHIASIFVATFGITFYAIVAIVNRVIPTKTEHNNTRSPDFVNVALVFIVVSFFGVALGSSLSFATLVVKKQVYMDYWIYERYLDMVLLPLLGIGLLSLWRFKYAVAVSFIVLISGLLLYWYVDGSNTNNINNLLNIQSLWPQALFSDKSNLFWYITGIVGIMLTNVLKKKMFIFLVIPLWIASISNQSAWHQEILAGHSKPSSLIALIPSNFPQGQCIGFDPKYLKNSSLFQKQRRRLYSYYFFNYDIRRMSPKEWLSDCDGPYLTYRPKVFSKTPEAKVIARETDSGLFLVVKTEKLGNISLKSLPSPMVNLRVDLTGNDDCMIKGCFDMNASDLIRFSPKDAYKDGKIISNEQSGYLFHGPYYPLKKGKYSIELKGSFANAEGVILDIVSGRGKKEHLKVTLSDHLNSDLKTISIPFVIKSNARDIEVRLLTTPDTKLMIDGYSIKLRK